MLKKKWQKVSVKDICSIRNGHGFGPEDWGTEGLPIIRIQNLNGGMNFDYYSGTPQERWLVEHDDLLFSWAGTKGVSFGPFVWRGPRGVLNQHIFKVEPKSGINKNWLYWALMHVTNRIENQAHGFKSTLVHVKKSDIDDQAVILPEESEQIRIAQILATWDKAISTSEKLLKNSRKQVRSLHHHLLLKPVLRAKWPMLSIGEISTRVQRRIETDEKFPILMISSGSGFVRQDEKYSRFMAGKSLDSYILLEKGEFAYNKGNSKRYEFGCIFPLKLHERGLVPNVYFCFSLIPSCVPGFFEQLFAADFLHDQLGALVNTGVRNNGLLNIRSHDFFACKVPVPPLEEQARIADTLATAKQWIDMQEAMLARLKQEKVALMEQLLTGKRRVHLPDVELGAQA